MQVVRSNPLARWTAPDFWHHKGKGTARLNEGSNRVRPCRPWGRTAPQMASSPIPAAGSRGSTGCRRVASKNFRLLQLTSWLDAPCCSKGAIPHEARDRIFRSAGFTSAFCRRPSASMSVSNQQRHGRQHGILPRASVTAAASYCIRQALPEQDMVRFPLL